MKFKQIVIYSVAFIITAMAVPAVSHAQLAVTRSITFPVLGGASYSNDYGDGRSGGRTHEGNDLMGKKMQTLVAATDGVVTYLPTTQPSWGWSVTIVDKDGYEYNYLHVNNDSPGTDDGLGGFNNAFPAGLQRGSRVVAGQAIAFMGDSGNAESTAPHLHFEIRVASTNEPINPYASLKAAPVIFTPAVNPNPGVVDDTPRWGNNPSTPTQTPTQVLASEILPYQDFDGGATITSANFDTDPEPEIVTGTAFGGDGRSIINVFDTNGSLTHKFFAYGEVFRGGVDVAAADVDGDGVAEIITAAGPGGGPHVKIFKKDGTLVSEFMAYGAGFRGGVYVSAADVDGDGQVEIVTGPGAGGGPHVRVFNKTGVVKQEWFAYGAGFAGGVDVAAFAKEGNIAGGFVTAPGATGGPHMKVYSSGGVVTKEFFAYEAVFTGGVRVDAGNVVANNGAIEIAMMPASNGSPTLKLFTTDGVQLKSIIAGFDATARGGYDVAIAGANVLVSGIGTTLKTTVKKVSVEN